eukprot:3408034-Rhodomonas_salina.5
MRSGAVGGGVLSWSALPRPLRRLSAASSCLKAPRGGRVWLSSACSAPRTVSEETRAKSQHEESARR